MYPFRNPIQFIFILFYSFTDVILILCMITLATQCVPTFVREIKDVRAKEEETVTFECMYSGMPVPGKDDLRKLNGESIDL